jgi:hypothetical protein
MPCDPGARMFPVRTNLHEELRQEFSEHWKLTYSHHFVGMHDLEKDSRVQYGQLSAVDQNVWETVAAYTNYIYGRPQQFNDEANGGTPCGKVALGHLLRHRVSGLFLIVVNVHGFWSRHGKFDCLARFQQNAGVNAIVQKLRSLQTTNAVHVLIIGDLNYTSKMMALYDLAEQPCFRGSGVILNHTFNIKETRTSYYKKSVREADFAIVSQSLVPHVENFRVLIDNIPSDHGLLELTLNL